MSHLRPFLLASALFLSCALPFTAQQKPDAPPPQTPREALIEILTGGSAGWSRHITVELKQKIAEQAKANNTPGAMVVFTAMSPSMMGLSLPAKGTETFKDGPVLLSVQEPNSAEKFELRIDGEDMRGDQSDLRISAHLFRDGQEQSIPFLSGVTLSMKMQEQIWRLSEIDVAVKLAVGDPKFFDDLAGLKRPATKPAESAGSAPPVREERPALEIERVMNFLGYAENAYAQQHPEAGFTCDLQELMGSSGKPSPIAGMLDPRIAGGSYNGYRFSITGCGSKPSETFHIVAEPDHTGPAATAFCVNSTQVVRSSADGRGSTCLSSGTVVQPAPGEDL